MKHTQRRRLTAILASAAAVAAAVVCISALCVLKGNVIGKEFSLYLHEGTDIKALRDSLDSDGRLLRPGRFALAARLARLDGSIRPGHYVFSPGMSAYRAVSMLRSGNQTPVRVTFNNIRTLPQLAGVLSRQIAADSADMARTLADDSTAMRYGFSPREFIGMFIPNTYEVYWTVSPDRFVARMHDEYQRFWEGRRTEALGRTGLSAREVSTLASIIDEETVHTDEMARMAGVYINRLRRGMPLQADPTVKFAVGDFSLRRILKSHLSVESPYNTYLHAGLPPGPIRMPSVAAIDAVLGYEEHDYLYFCAKADFSGYHSFARTLAEHNRNARAYSAALDRNGIR